MDPIEAGQLCNQTWSALEHGTNQLKDVPGLIARVIRERAWECRQVPLRREFIRLGSLQEMIETKPPEGWGEKADKIKALIEADKDHPEIAVLWREEMKGKEGGDKVSEKAKTTGNNVTSAKPRVTGNSRAYTLTRLQRERPDLFADVKAGRLSANAAAIQAGFRKKPTGLQVLERAWSKATAREREEFLDHIDFKPSRR